MYAENGGGIFAIFLLYLSVWKTGASTEGCPDIVLRSPHFAKVHGGTCYLFVDQERYWNDARSACWTMGGEMLSIRDEGTMRFIGSVLSSRQLRWFREGVWLGARYIRARWRWTTGITVDYNNWAHGEPSLFMGLFSMEDCAVMRRNDNWQWHDYPCASLKFHYNYICEFPFNSVGGHEAHTEYTRDNGNLTVLTIILTSGGVVLLILLVVFLVVRRRYNYRKLISDPDVHFDNRSYDLAVRQPAGPQPSSLSTLPPPPPAHLSASRTPSSNLDQHPAQMEGAAALKANGITVCLLKESTSQPAESASTSLSCSDEDLGACGGLDAGEGEAWAAGDMLLSSSAGAELSGSTGKVHEGLSGSVSQGTGHKHAGNYLLMNGHPLTSAHNGLVVEPVDRMREEKERGGGEGSGGEGGGEQPGRTEEEESQPSTVSGYSDPATICKSSDNLCEDFP